MRPGSHAAPLWIAFCAVLAAAPAAAQDGAAFFDGKTITYIVSTAPGGGYDTNGRLVAEYLQKYLPGSTVIVQNMPGAGHIIGANFIFASEPDGLTIGTFNTGLIYNQLVENEGVQFDLAEMSWIGKVASEPRDIIVSADSGIESYEQLMALDQPIRFGSAGVGSASYVESVLLKDALGMPVELISGYNGRDDQLAMRRGEIAGIIASRSSYQQFVDEGHARFVAQIGGSESDVPQVADLVEGEEAASAVALIATQSDIARLTAGPPGIPADRLDALREAYRQAVADPEFVERARSLGLPVDPLVGEELREAVSAALDQPADVVELLRKALAEGQ